jgi:SAM-dependent methyltransferase
MGPARLKPIYGHPGIYDITDTLLSLGLSDRVRRMVVSGIDAASFLEIGVGSGKNLDLVDSELRVGVDMSRRMLDHAKSRFEGVGLVLGDAHRLPFGDSSFDVSLLCYTLKSLARPEEAVREGLRVSSKVVVIEYDRLRLLPRLVWDHLIDPFGAVIFGSRALDFAAIAGAAKKVKVTGYFGGLYRVMVLEGIKHA